MGGLCPGHAKMTKKWLKAIRKQPAQLKKVPKNTREGNEGVIQRPHKKEEVMVFSMLIP